jgi:hypothetical protein
VVVETFGEDEPDPIVIPTLPQAMRIQRNSYRQADGWELTFDADDLPLDPQQVRAGAAELFLFNRPGIVEDEQVLNKASSFEDSANRQDRSAVDERMIEAQLAGAVGRFTFGNEPQVAGLFDEHSLTMSADGRWVTISGQDYTDFLIKKQWKPTSSGRARRIPTGKRVDRLLADLLAEADEEGRLRIKVENVDAASLPVVGRKETRSHRRGIPVEQDTSYWDVMYKVAIRYGFILFVRGLDVVLTLPQHLSEKDSGRVRRLTYGRNIAELELSRRLGTETAPTIVVQAYDPSTRKTTTVEYPDGAFTKVKRSGGRRTPTGKRRKASINKTEEYQIVPVYGITDRAVLRDRARTLHTLLGRAERQVKLVTHDLADNADKGLLDLAAGDAFSVTFEDFNREAFTSEDLDEETRFTRLVQRGYGEAIARVIARNQGVVDILRRPLRVREATLDWESESGLSIEMQLLDFVVVGGDRSTTRERSADRRAQGLRKTDGKPLGLRPELADALVKERT